MDYLKTLPDYTDLPQVDQSKLWQEYIYIYIYICMEKVLKPESEETSKKGGKEERKTLRMAEPTSGIHQTHEEET